MAAARAYSAVIEALSPRGSGMRAHRALVKLFIGRQCHLPRLPLAHRLPATPFHRGPLAAMLDICFTL